MRGDWRDQKLSANYQQMILQQVEQTRLAQTMHSTKERAFNLSYRIFRAWLNRLFKNMNQANTALNKSQELRAVK